MSSNNWGVETTEVVDISEEPKLIVVIMGPGKEDFAKICLESVKDADKVLYWTSETNMIEKECDDKFSKNVEVHWNGWDEKDPSTNGKCRQEYLEHLKEKYPNDWCLVLDEDEFIEDLGKIKLFIKEALQSVYSVKMRHLIGDLGHEDATNEVHVVPHRLFKISEVEKYPEHSHPVLEPKEGKEVGMYLDTTIWHLGNCPINYLDYLKKRYKQHCSDSIIHTSEFLELWYHSHLFGKYPVKEVNPIELPKILLDRYEINSDKYYFQNRGLETKHFIDVYNWKQYFKLGEQNGR